jgi:hypothetical protein
MSFFILLSALNFINNMTLVAVAALEFTAPVAGVRK